MIYSLVIFIPDTLKASTNAVATALNWQPLSGDTMNMAYQDASGNAWWGCRAQANDETIQMIDAAKAGTWPDADWGNVLAQDRQAIASAMLINHIPDNGTVDYAAHIRDFAASNNLTATENKGM